MFWSKVHRHGNDILVAICDEELLGKEIKVKKDFSIKIKKEFYGGKKIDKNKAIELLKVATIANLFGNKIVEISIKNGFILEKNVIKFKGISHAQIINL